MRFCPTVVWETDFGDFHVFVMGVYRERWKFVGTNSSKLLDKQVVGWRQSPTRSLLDLNLLGNLFVINQMHQTFQ